MIMNHCGAHSFSVKWSGRGQCPVCAMIRVQSNAIGFLQGMSIAWKNGRVVPSLDGLKEVESIIKEYKDAKNS